MTDIDSTIVLDEINELKNKIKSQDKYISDLVDHISDLEQTQKELIEFLRLEHQAKSLMDEWVYCHEVDKCPTCKLIQRIVGEK